MANRNTQGFGFLPADSLTGQAIKNQHKYKIDAAHGTSIYQGGFVISEAGATGYIDSAGTSTTDELLGVFNGIFYNATTTLKPTWANAYIQPITPANSEDITAFVMDNPFQRLVAAAATSWTQAAVLATFGVTSTGNDTTGRSTGSVTITSTSADANCVRLYGSADDSENADNTATFSSVVVSMNTNRLVP